MNSSEILRDNYTFYARYAPWNYAKRLSGLGGRVITLRANSSEPEVSGTFEIGPHESITIKARRPESLGWTEASINEYLDWYTKGLAEGFFGFIKLISDKIGSTPGLLDTLKAAFDSEMAEVRAAFSASRSQGVLRAAYSGIKPLMAVGGEAWDNIKSQVNMGVDLLTFCTMPGLILYGSTHKPYETLVNAGRVHGSLLFWIVLGKAIGSAAANRVASGYAESGIEGITPKESGSPTGSAPAITPEETPIKGSGEKPYESIYESSVEGTTRSAHRYQANKQFYEALKNDPILKQEVDDLLGVDVLKHMESGKGALKNPLGTEWHHPIDNPAVVELLQKNVHRNPLLQDILHSLPNRGGGMMANY